MSQPQCVNGAPPETVFWQLTKYSDINKTMQLYWIVFPCISAYLGVVIDLNTLELTEADQVGAHEDPELPSLLLSFVLVPGVTLVLHAHPQFVHLSKIQLDEINGVLHCASVRLTENGDKWEKINLLISIKASSY